MTRGKANSYPKTKHKKVAGGSRDKNDFVVLDNPDDRMTQQTGSGMTLIENDNPDDVPEKR